MYEFNQHCGCKMIHYGVATYYNRSGALSQPQPQYSFSTARRCLYDRPFS